MGRAGTSLQNGCWVPHREGRIILFSVCKVKTKEKCVSLMHGDLNSSSSVMLDECLGCSSRAPWEKNCRTLRNFSVLVLVSGSASALCCSYCVLVFAAGQFIIVRVSLSKPAQHPVLNKTVFILVLALSQLCQCVSFLACTTSLCQLLIIGFYTQPSSVTHNTSFPITAPNTAMPNSLCPDSPHSLLWPLVPSLPPCL